MQWKGFPSVFATHICNNSIKNCKPKHTTLANDDCGSKKNNKIQDKNIGSYNFFLKIIAKDFVNIKHIQNSKPRITYSKFINRNLKPQ